MQDNSCFQISYDLQRDILSLIMTDRDFLINSMSLIKPEYFVDIAHQSICKYIQEYFQEYNKPATFDILTQIITNEFSNNKNLARFLTEIDIISERIEVAFQEKEYLNDLVIRFAKNQAMKNAVLQSVPLIESENYTEIEELIRQALLVAPDVSLGSDLLENVEDRYRRLLLSKDAEKFTTTFEEIDKELEGGIGRKEVGMVFALSGVGKSLWCSQVAIENIKKGKNVLYISCEMSEDKVLIRGDSMLSRVPLNDIMHSYREVIKKHEMIKPHIKGKLIVKEFPAGESTITDFKTYAHQLYNFKGFKPDLVILDYIDEVKPSNSKVETYTAQYQTLREFRAWAVNENFAGVTATQANRMARDAKTITDKEIGDSYAKIRIVDSCWSINQTDAEKARQVARLFVVKHRNAKSRFTVYLKQCPNTYRFFETTEEEYIEVMGDLAVTDF